MERREAGNIPECSSRLSAVRASKVCADPNSYADYSRDYTASDTDCHSNLRGDAYPYPSTNSLKHTDSCAL